MSLVESLPSCPFGEELLLRAATTDVLSNLTIWPTQAIIKNQTCMVAAADVYYFRCEVYAAGKFSDANARLASSYY